MNRRHHRISRAPVLPRPLPYDEIDARADAWSADYRAQHLGALMLGWHAGRRGDKPEACPFGDEPRVTRWRIGHEAGAYIVIKTAPRAVISFAERSQPPESESGEDA